MSVTQPKEVPGRAAIDCMYYVATRDFMEKWDEAKRGELECRMERSIGGLPRYESIEKMIELMDEADVQKVFIAQCKMWSHKRQWMYMDTKLDDVLQYTNRFPDRFYGLAGYNPFALPGVLTTLGNINPNDGAVSLLFSTHPSPRERLDRIEASVGDRLDRYAGGVDNTATFARLHK